jgi:N-acetylglucosaminyl-diphospho-decaprenol L-rhamnosyltransferase
MTPLHQRFTAIIVNYNGQDLLLDCVRSILEAGLSHEHIVVVDNGSKDESMKMLLEHVPNCGHILMGCNAGFAAAVNTALRQVDTEFAVLINNDARVTSATLPALLKAFEAHPQAAFIGGRLFNQDGSLQNAIAPFPRLTTELLPPLLRKILRFEQSGRYSAERDIRVESVIGALFAIRISATHQIGLLDEDFFFFLEETEWCHRATQLGWEVWHVPMAQALHLQGATAKKFNAMARIEFHRSRLTYFGKTAPGQYPLVLTIAWLKAILNALSNSIIVMLTLGLSVKIRQKSWVYWKILQWYVTGRPDEVGLPDKCPTSMRTSKS